MIMFPISLITALGTVMLPRMSNLYTKGKQNDAEKILGASIQLAMMLSSALCFGLASISDKFSVLFFGSEYELTGVIIRYLCVTIWLISFNNIIRTQYIIPNQKDMIYVIAVSGGAIINLVVNAILIPYIGAVGAAIGSICAYLFVFIWQTTSVRKDIPVGKYLMSTLSTVVIGMIMFIGVYSMDRILPVGWKYLIIEIVSGVLIFSVVSLLYMAKFDKSNICYSYYLRIVSHIRKMKHT